MANQNRGTITPYGRWIKNRLMDLGMTQKELAAKLGIQPQHLSAIIYGKWAGNKYKTAIKEALKEKL